MDVSGGPGRGRARTPDSRPPVAPEPVGALLDSRARLGAGRGHAHVGWRYVDAQQRRYGNLIRRVFQRQHGWVRRCQLHCLYPGAGTLKARGTEKYRGEYKVRVTGIKTISG